MPRKPTDWKQKYENSIIQTERDVKNIFNLRKELDDIQERHKGLNKEFDKAVEINKGFQHTIIEQRGIINYLEGKRNA